MLFEMLTGRPPYRADTPVGVLVAHVTEPTLACECCNPCFPTRFRWCWIGRWRRTPDRYQSATELAADLAAVAEKNTGSCSNSVHWSMLP